MVEYTKKIVYGTITNSISTVVSVVGSIITVPLFLHAVSIEHYGLFVVVSSIVGFVGLSDFGITSAVTNKISYFFAEEKKQDISELFSGAVWFMAGIFLVLSLIIGILFLSGVLSVRFIFGVAPEMVQLTNYLFLVLLFFASINILLGGMITSFFIGINEISRYNLLQASYTILYSVSFIIFLLIYKPNILEIALFQGSMLFVRIIILFVVAKKVFGWFKFYFNFWLFKKVIPLLRHSISFFFLSFCNNLIGKTDLLVISHVLGVASAPLFSISDKIFRLPAQAIQVSASAMPSIANLHMLQKKEQLAKLYSQVVRMHIILRLSALFILLVFSKEIITIWVGATFFHSYYLVFCFFISYMIYSWVGPHFEFINSMFKQNVEIIPMVINVIINLVVSIVLAYYIGIIGVVIGTILGNLLTNVVYLPIFLKKQIVIRPLYEITHIGVSFLLPAIFFILSYIGVCYIFDNYLCRLIAGVLVSIPYFALVYFVTLHKNERAFMYDKIVRCFSYLR